MELSERKSTITAMMADIEFQLVELVHKCTQELAEDDPIGEEFEQFKTKLACAQILTRLYRDIKESKSEVMS